MNLSFNHCLKLVASAAGGFHLPKALKIPVQFRKIKMNKFSFLSLTSHPKKPNFSWRKINEQGVCRLMISYTQFDFP